MGRYFGGIEQGSVHVQITADAQKDVLRNTGVQHFEIGLIKKVVPVGITGAYKHQRAFGKQLCAAVYGVYGAAPGYKKDLIKIVTVDLICGMDAVLVQCASAALAQVSF